MAFDAAAYGRTWYARNKERVKAWRRANREHNREVYNRWAKNNRERINAIQKRYYERHKDELRERRNARRRKGGPNFRPGKPRKKLIPYAGKEPR